MKFRQIIASSFVVAAILTSCDSDDDLIAGNSDEITGVDETVKELNADVQLLLASIEADGGTPFDYENPAVAYTEDQNVFIPSSLGIDYRLEGNGTTSTTPAVTLPMFQGWQGDGEAAYYVITEASDETVAKQLGIIYAPRMADAGAAGSQAVTWSDDGRLIFPGTVDFSFKRSLVAGTDNRELGEDLYGLLSFPPNSAEAGAIADDEWSSYVVLPSGVVLNAQQVGNVTGRHDRIPVIDTSLDGQDDFDNPNFSTETASVALQLLDGWQGGEQYYYHIVTDTSDPGPAAIEKGVFAPRLALIETFGNFPGGAFLPFSPCANGNPLADENGLIQGLNVAIDSDDQNQDPTNTFPIDPDDETEYYTPMWDAHVVEWLDTDARTILKSAEEIEKALAEGTLDNFRGNNTDVVNDGYLNLSSLGATINCPVITQPTSSVVEEGIVIGFNLTDL